jgi:hypothetical protein
MEDDGRGHCAHVVENSPRFAEGNWNVKTGRYSQKGSSKMEEHLDCNRH